MIGSADMSVSPQNPKETHGLVEGHVQIMTSLFDSLGHHLSRVEAKTCMLVGSDAPTPGVPETQAIAGLPGFLDDHENQLRRLNFWAESIADRLDIL